MTELLWEWVKLHGTCNLEPVKLYFIKKNGGVVIISITYTSSYVWGRGNHEWQEHLKSTNSDFQVYNALVNYSQCIVWWTS